MERRETKAPGNFHFQGQCHVRKWMLGERRPWRSSCQLQEAASLSPTLPGGNMGRVHQPTSCPTPGIHFPRPTPSGHLDLQETEGSVLWRDCRGLAAESPRGHSQPIQAGIPEAAPQEQAPHGPWCRQKPQDSHGAMNIFPRTWLPPQCPSLDLGKSGTQHTCFEEVASLKGCFK